MAQATTTRILLADLFPAFAGRTALRFAPGRLAFRPITFKPASAQPPRFFTSHPKPRSLAFSRSGAVRRFWTSRTAQEEAKAAQAEGNVGLFDRVRDLTRRYGSAALVVYLGLGAIDFSIAFVLILMIGADHVRAAEDWVLDQLHWRRKAPHERKPVAEAARDKVIEAEEVLKEKATEVVQSVKDGKHEKGHADQSTLATTAVLAYAIHKTVLLPFRVGLVAWATPRIVRILRGWGWNVGKPAATASLAFLVARRENEARRKSALQKPRLE